MKKTNSTSNAPANDREISIQHEAELQEFLIRLMNAPLQPLQKDLSAIQAALGPILSEVKEIRDESMPAISNSLDESIKSLDKLKSNFTQNLEEIKQDIEDSKGRAATLSSNLLTAIRTHNADQSAAIIEAQRSAIDELGTASSKQSDDLQQIVARTRTDLANHAIKLHKVASEASERQDLEQRDMTQRLIERVEMLEAGFATVQSKQTEELARAASSISSELNQRSNIIKRLQLAAIAIACCNVGIVIAVASKWHL